MVRDRNIHIIIAAAGFGSRYGDKLPKQYCLLGGEPVLMHTIRALRRALPKAELTLVISPEMQDLWAGLCAEHSFESPRTVMGGGSRWESVRNAVEAIPAEGADIVMVHDGARPVVTPQMARRLADAIDCGAVAAIPVVGVTDSLRMLQDGGGSSSVDRSRLVAVQTPQAFRADTLKAAYRLPYSPLFTDDASVVEAAGFGAPALVEGSPFNIKITHPHDIEVAAIYLKSIMMNHENHENHEFHD